MKDPFDEQLVDWFESQTLPDEQLDQILTQGGRIRRQRQLRRVGWVSFVLVPLVALAVWLWPTSSPIAAQLVASHASHGADEYLQTVEHFSDLEAKMDRLPFALQPIEVAMRDRFELNGARYCKVGDEIACAFAVRERVGGTGDGAEGVVFVSQVTDALMAQSGLSERLGRHRVETWVSNTHFFCFVAGPLD